MNIPRRRIYDVCVVGSGAAGGFMAKEMAEAGAKVILLEAGRKIDPASLGQHDYPYELQGRAEKAGRRSPLVPDFAVYENRGRDAVGLSRERVLGGRTTHWNAAVFRFSEDDFREHSLHGVEEDWPLTYRELAPFYSYVERILPVCGTREGLREAPDGEFYAAPPALRCSEQIAGRACRKLGMRLIPTRKAMLIGRRRSAPGRAPCHYCGHCMQVCDVGAIFTSANTTIPQALLTGNLSLRTNALAREILVDGRGRASGVSFVSTATGREETVRASVVVVSCATVESARLLLNSRSEKFPNGLANSNDVVGRYLHGHTVANMTGYLSELVGTAPVNNDGANDHGYIPRFNHLRGGRGYVGGFHVQTQYLSFMHPRHARTVPGFGPAFKSRVRDLHPALLHFGGFGKVMAQRENRVRVDQTKADQFGIPTPVAEFAYGDNDRRLFRDMVESLEEIYRTAEVDLVSAPPDIAGFASHEVGTCRMGRDPRTSVLNSYCRTHEVPNLFVVDGSCFTTSPEKNPTLTIMALAVRSARYIVGERRKGNL